MQPAEPSIAAPAPERPKRPRRRRGLVYAGGAAVVLATLGFWASRSGFEWEARWIEFRSAFRGVDWLWLGLAGAAALLTYAGRALRWRLMMSPVKANPGFWSIVEATCIGFTAIVLFGRAGELVRPYLISARERVPFPSQVAAWLLERVLDLMMVLLIFGIALIGISHRGAAAGAVGRLVQVGGSIIALAGIACVAFLIAFRYFSDTMHRRISDCVAYLPERIGRRVQDLLGAFITGMGCTRSGAFVTRLLLYSLAEWALITLVFLAVMRAFPPTHGLSVVDVVVALGVVAIGSAVQIPGVGGGMQVATVLALTELFHVPVGASTGIALVLWVISFLLIVPIGTFFAVRQGLSFRNLAHISEEAA